MVGVRRALLRVRSKALDCTCTSQLDESKVVVADSVEARLRRLRLPVGNRRVSRCSLAFIAYEPSKWEEEWRTQAKEYQQHTCKTMLQQKHLVDAWMEPMNATFMAGSAAATEPAFQDSKVPGACWSRNACAIKGCRCMLGQNAATDRFVLSRCAGVLALQVQGQLQWRGGTAVSMRLERAR